LCTKAFAPFELPPKTVGGPVDKMSVNSSSPYRP
jgi:hypothetical protein